MIRALQESGPAMQLTISRCHSCKKARLVDRVEDKWVCFACKQRASKTSVKPIDHFVRAG
jgi:ribosomal protein L37AE/L43A